MRIEALAIGVACRSADNAAIQMRVLAKVRVRAQSQIRRSRQRRHSRRLDGQGTSEVGEEEKLQKEGKEERSVWDRAHSSIVDNTIVTFTDPLGNVLAWSRSGSFGFRGSRKGTPFAAQQASLTAANKAKEAGLRTVDHYVAGPGSGREWAVRALSTAGIEVRSIKDVTPIPHNGCRPPKEAASMKDFRARSAAMRGAAKGGFVWHVIAAQSAGFAVARA